jgi:hypothetical protein
MKKVQLSSRLSALDRLHRTPTFYQFSKGDTTTKSVVMADTWGNLWAIVVELARGRAGLLDLYQTNLPFTPEAQETPLQGFLFLGFFWGFCWATLGYLENLLYYQLDKKPRILGFSN